MTLKEARKVFKDYAPTKCRGSRKDMLRTLIELTLRGNNEVDLGGRHSRSR